MDVILSSNDHPDAEEIYIRARQKSDQASIATTYRTLTVLSEAGMIKNCICRMAKPVMKHKNRP